jgi:hypothetical protein
VKLKKEELVRYLMHLGGWVDDMDGIVGREVERDRARRWEWEEPVPTGGRATKLDSVNTENVTLALIDIDIDVDLLDDDHDSSNDVDYPSIISIAALASAQLFHAFGMIVSYQSGGRPRGGSGGDAKVDMDGMTRGMNDGKDDLVEDEDEDGRLRMAARRCLELGFWYRNTLEDPVDAGRSGKRAGTQVMYEGTRRGFTPVSPRSQRTRQSSAKRRPNGPARHEWAGTSILLDSFTEMSATTDDARKHKTQVDERLLGMILDRRVELIPGRPVVRRGDDDGGRRQEQDTHRFDQEHRDEGDGSDETYNAFLHLLEQTTNSRHPYCSPSSLSTARYLLDLLSVISANLGTVSTLLETLPGMDGRLFVRWTRLQVGLRTLDVALLLKSWEMRMGGARRAVVSEAGGITPARNEGQAMSHSRSASSITHRSLSPSTISADPSAALLDVLNLIAEHITDIERERTEVTREDVGVLLKRRPWIAGAEEDADEVDSDDQEDNEDQEEGDTEHDSESGDAASDATPKPPAKPAVKAEVQPVDPPEPILATLFTLYDRYVEQQRAIWLELPFPKPKCDRFTESGEVGVAWRNVVGRLALEVLDG